MTSLPSHCCGLPIRRSDAGPSCSGCGRSLAVLSLTVRGLGGRRFSFAVLAAREFLPEWRSAGLDIDECIEIGPASEMPAGVAWRGGFA